MSRQSVAFVALLSVAVSLVSAQDIIFPGQTMRPSRYPLPGPRPTTPFPALPKIEPTTQPPVVPSVTPPSTKAYNDCVVNCMVTSEYNPVCGSDGVVYSNPGKLKCAFSCGNPVQFVRYGQCRSAMRG